MSAHSSQPSAQYLWIAGVTGLLCLVWVGSLWWNLGWMSERGGYGGVASGRLVIGRSGDVPPPNPDAGWSFRRHGTHASWWLEFTTEPGGWSIAMPLWVPIVGCAGAFATTWRRWNRKRRRVRAGACWVCGYPLSDLPHDSRCPECGGVRRRPTR